MRWFLFGKSHGYETITNLALDRIEKIVSGSEEYMETDIDFSQYFEDIIGVTIPNEKATPGSKIFLKLPVTPPSP